MDFFLAAVRSHALRVIHVTDVKIEEVLTCAAQLQTDLGFPSSARWILMGDSKELGNDPEIRKLKISGKLIDTTQ